MGKAMRAEIVGWLNGYYSSPAAVMMEPKEDGFRENMLTLADKSPELRRLAEERGALEQRYEELLNRTVTGRGPAEPTSR